MGLFLLLVALLPACAGVRPVQLYDTENWPSLDTFQAPDVYEDVVAIMPVVTVIQQMPHESGNQDWYGIQYDIQVTGASGRPLHGVIVGARLDEAMEPWILSGMLVFGSDRDAPVDLGPGEGRSRGLIVTRQSGIPNPARLSPEERQRLRAAIMTPIWLKITWDGEPHYIRLDPEDIQYEGLELIGD